MTRPRSAPLLPALLLLAACAPETGAPPPDATGSATGSSAPAAAEPAPASLAAAEAGRPERPGLRVDTLDHGVFDLAEQRGRWVVVNFWATWCAPCIKEIPELNALDAGREDVVVIGLAYEETTPEALRRFYAEKVRAEYPVAIVDVFNPPADFKTPRGLPYTVLLDPSGKVVREFLGPVTGADLLAAIAAAGGPA
ncbi:MAG: TlpA family protein disulfide reductase [Xanthomonadaceae bacterium]|jgi:thiol-disulfide isomerase/thioredoxin|nr:TlpA family protein disulfide reductase [Xanthomonadaceae bacterium]